MNEILEKVDWDVLNSYVDQKLIRVKKHDVFDLYTLNYTEKCQYEKIWDTYTLSCRGLIIDAQGNIVARSLKKFFNFSEIDPNTIPKENYTVLEKLDGSCIITYKADGVYYAATRGSFNSDQAKKATPLIQKYSKIFDEYEDYTFVFEYVGPDNRIVVHYPKEEVILIAVINKKNGLELSLDTFNVAFKVAKKYKKISDSFNDAYNDDEGVVFRFQSGFRIKVKNEEYVRLHKIVTFVSLKNIWEALKNNTDISDLLTNVPDEFFMMIKSSIKTLKDKFLEIEKTHFDFFSSIPEEIKRNRKSFASLALQRKDLSSGVIFSMLDGKDFSKTIWDLVKESFDKEKFVRTLSNDNE